MEFIQKKTADSAVEYFLTKAADEGVPLAWDRYEGQLPECGFCETGLSCRDCLQGPCISHPFRDSNKLGVCGKDKDVLASQSLLRLVLKGTLAYLDQISDFTNGIESRAVTPKNKTRADQLLKEIQRFFKDGNSAMKKEFPKALALRWDKAGVTPEGITRDLFKAFQKLEGGIAGGQEILLWAFKAALFGSMSRRLHGALKRAVFGETGPTNIELNLGAIKKETPTLLLYGPLSPILKLKIAQAAKKKGVNVMGVCTDPLLPPYSFSPVTTYGSQEIPLMTGAVDLIVAGDQYVNPSLSVIAKDWDIALVSAEGLKKGKDLEGFARRVVDQAKKSYDFRREIPRHIPETKESAILGFSVQHVDIKKIVAALSKGKIQGIAILSGSNNVKYTQDKELSTMTKEFLKNDILCVSTGEASIGLAKYGLLNPDRNATEIGSGLSELLSSLGKNLPPVLDFGSSENGGAIDFLLALANAGKKDLKDYPIIACFSEANRSSEVADAISMVAMGVSTYFWPQLPVTGSTKIVEALSEFCAEQFGAKFHIVTDKKLEGLTKAKLVLKTLGGDKGYGMSGQGWK